MNILFWPLQPFVNKRDKDATFVLDQPALQILMSRKITATLTESILFLCNRQAVFASAFPYQISPVVVSIQ